MLRALILGALLTGTLLAYAPILGSETRFVYEDEMTLQNNPMVRGMQPISLSTARWLTWTTYRIDCWRSGSAASFHRSSLLLHLLVVGLVFLAMRRESLTDGALIAAGIVALHPLNTEAVAYLTGRSELIFAIGVLCAWLCRPSDQRWTILRVGGVLIGTYLAIGGKELGIVTPLLVSLRKPLPRWAWAGFGLIGIFILLQLNDHHMALGASPYPFWTALRLECVAVVRGLRLLVWPLGLTVDAQIGSAGLFWQIACAGLVLSLIPLAWVTRHTPIGFALTWLAITLGPRVLADSWELITEHQWYVPLMGIAFAAGHLYEYAMRPALAPLNPHRLVLYGAGDEAW